MLRKSKKVQFVQKDVSVTSERVGAYLFFSKLSDFDQYASNFLSFFEILVLVRELTTHNYLSFTRYGRKDLTTRSDMTVNDDYCSSASTAE